MFISLIRHLLNKKSYFALREKMESVMHDYIQKASIGLEGIVKNLKKLKAQKQYK